METTQINLKKDLFRIDRDFAKNPTVFREFGEDERLIKSLVAYVFLMFRNGKFDLFNKLRIDPAKFGEEMGYKRAELFRKVESPLQLNGLKPKDVARMKAENANLYETKLENALYKMMSRNLMFTQIMGETTTHKVERTQAQQILTHVDTYTDKNNKGKKYYDISVKDTFLELLNRYFVNIDKNAFILTRDSNLSDLYFFLSDVQQYCLGHDIRAYDKVSFDFLCDLIGISPNYAPRKKKQVLKEKFESIIAKIPELGLKLTFVSNGKHLYQPVIVFDKQVDTPEIKKERGISINNEKVNYCVAEIKLKWKEYFAVNYPGYADSPELLSLKCEDWLNTGLDVESKCKVILEVMTKFFPRSEFVSKVTGRDFMTFEKDYVKFFKSIKDLNDLPRPGLF